VSRGLGWRQLAVLTILANHEAAITEEKPGLLVAEIAQQFQNSEGGSAATRSSIRRALAKMLAVGLVEWMYYPHLQGQPRIWRVTPAGLEIHEAGRAPRPAS
jgi:hypothetical protein